MARQTPQQKRANAQFAKANEKNMGRPESLTRKKEVQKSPLSNGMLIFLAFVVCGTMGLGFAEVGGAMWSGFLQMLRRIGLLS